MCWHPECEKTLVLNHLGNYTRKSTRVTLTEIRQHVWRLIAWVTHVPMYPAQFQLHVFSGVIFNSVLFHSQRYHYYYTINYFVTLSTTLWSSGTFRLKISIFKPWRIEPGCVWNAFLPWSSRGPGTRPWRHWENLICISYVHLQLGPE